MPKPSFDSLDYEIMKLLKHNARLTAAQIARVLEANERTIRKRIERMENLKAIRFMAIPNPQAFGYTLSVDIFIQTDERRDAIDENIVAKILSFDEVSYIAYGENAKKISIEAIFKGNEDFEKFLKYKLGAIDGISVASYALVPTLVKDTYDWMPKPDDFS